MTEAELVCARELRARVRELEHRQAELRAQSENLVPLMDGQPKSTTIKSRVEELALKIVTLDGETSHCRELYMEAARELDEKIAASDLDALEKAVLNLRYVSCLNFLEIQERLRISKATVFYMHRSARRKILNLIQHN